MVESEEGWLYGSGTSRLQRSKEGEISLQLFSDQNSRWYQVKRILVPQRENAIVNRLNKTKVEKFPDLMMEREELLKSVRKKEQAVRLERVRLPISSLCW